MPTPLHARATSDPGELLTIGKVLDLLREEFPGLAQSKLHYLEDQGHIKPVRTAAGYRKYSLADVDRIRYVLRLQRDHYLPHSAIGEHLDALDRGLEPPPVSGPGLTVPLVALSGEGTPSAEAFRVHSDTRVSRKELLKISDVDEGLLTELEGMGLIGANRSGYYDTDALVVARTARELSEFGIEPRHLRGMKAAADREVGLIEQVVAPHRRASDPAAQARADDTASEIAALAVRLHATLVKSGLRRR
jgi:DNA-binding transcriptional MerR regulator